MSEYDQNIDIQISSEKSFGIVFAAIFFLIAFYPLLNRDSPHIWSIVIGILFLGLAYLAPRLLVLPNKIWFKLGLAIGVIITPIVIALIYFTTVAPVGLIIRLTGKDLLQHKLNSEIKSYWVERKQSFGSMEDQF